jgi:hypothetical protein
MNGPGGRSAAGSPRMTSQRAIFSLDFSRHTKGDRVGGRRIKAITPVSADKIYDRIVAGPRGQRSRQGEKLIGLCARAWSVVRRLYPDAFDSEVPNPCAA